MFFLNLLRSESSISDKLIIALAFLIVVIFSIVVHENSHGLVALWNGDYTAKASGRLTMNPLAHFNPLGLIMFLLVGFGWAKPVPIDPRNFKNYKVGMITVSIAGVSSNLIMAGLGLLLLLFLTPFLMISSSVVFVAVIQKLFLYIFIYGVQINFMLALFNMLPIYPLDGYNLVNTLLPNNTKFQDFMIKYGFFVLIGIIMIGQIGDMFGFPYLDIFGMFSNAVSDLVFRVMAASLGIFA